MIEALYECVRISKHTQQQSRTGSGNEKQSRWERIVNNKNDAEVWRAVNWADEFSSHDNTIKPSDEEFKVYIESNQNFQDVPMSWGDFSIRVTVPVLDEPKNVCETECEARILKANKTFGPDGFTPGIFKMLPGLWLLVLTTIVNSIFSEGVYPAA